MPKVKIQWCNDGVKETKVLTRDENGAETDQQWEDRVAGVARLAAQQATTNCSPPFP